MTPTTKAGRDCPWSWHSLPCALLRAHPGPHHIVGEQPRFLAIEREAAAEAEALRAALEGCVNALHYTITTVDGMHWCRMPNGHHEATCAGLLSTMAQARATPVPAPEDPS